MQPEKHGNTKMGEDYTPLPRSVHSSVQSSELNAEKAIRKKILLLNIYVALFIWQFLSKQYMK